MKYIDQQIDIFNRTPPKQALLEVFPSELSENDKIEIGAKLDSLLSYDNAVHPFSPSEVFVLMQSIDKLKILLHNTKIFKFLELNSD